LKPGIDNDYLLLQHVKFITKIDWKNADGFRKLPLVPEDLASYDVLKDNNTLNHGSRLTEYFQLESDQLFEGLYYHPSDI
jgi:hypothetical protein